MWVDYTLESIGEQGQGFTVRGEWPGEVMGFAKDGTPRQHWLYKPGDVFVVNEKGWLIKKDEVEIFLDKGKS